MIVKTLGLMVCDLRQQLVPAGVDCPSGGNTIVFLLMADVIFPECVMISL
jgi:hypothetical protein